MNDVGALARFQDAVGRLVLAPEAGTASAPAAAVTMAADASATCERALLARIAHSAGLRFTRSVQQSWCRARVARTAVLTLAVLAPEHRDVVLSTWLQQGGGARSFSADEGIAFLDLVAATLEPCSHAATLCRFERAVHVAGITAGGAAGGQQAGQPAPCTPADHERRLERGSAATVMRFHAPPGLVLAAARDGTALPPWQAAHWPLLVAPGVPGLVHLPDADQLALLERQDWPQPPSALLAGGHSLGVINGLLACGALAWRPAD